MTPDDDDTIAQQASLWAVRTGDPAFDGWEEFTLWLEADPAHAGAYDRVVAAVDDMAALLPAEPAAPLAANDDVPPATPARRRWLGGGIAAALAVVGLVGLLAWQGRAVTYQTAPGETQLVELDNGDTILLAGDSQLELDEGDALARLERGRALFTLTHGGGEPLTVAVGEARMIDVGTVFDVARKPGGLSVAVSDGAVLFDPDGERVRVAPGHMLVHDTVRGTTRVDEVAAAQVGEWAQGRLTFADAPLSDVAAELTRATGIRFRAGAGPAISGSIVLAPVRADPRSLQALLGVPVRRSGEAWVLGTD